MTAAILSLLAALIPFAIWLWRRKAAKNDDPTTQKEIERTEFDAAVVRGDTDSVNAALDARLRRLPGAGSGNTSGSSPGASQGKPAL